MRSGQMRKAIVKAFQLKLIDDEELWLQILRDGHPYCVSLV